jgi:transposase-like protein
MRKKRHNYSPEEKVSILRRHLIDRVPVSDLCDEYQLQPSVFYDWQKLFFENGASAFSRTQKSQKTVETDRIQQLEEKLQRTEEKLQRKHEVLSELVEEHVKLKKELGEL